MGWWWKIKMWLRRWGGIAIPVGLGGAELLRDSELMLEFWIARVCFVLAAIWFLAERGLTSWRHFPRPWPPNLVREVVGRVLVAIVLMTLGLAWASAREKQKTAATDSPTVSHTSAPTLAATSDLSFSAPYRHTIITSAGTQVVPGDVPGDTVLGVHVFVRNNTGTTAVVHDYSLDVVFSDGARRHGVPYRLDADFPVFDTNNVARVVIKSTQSLELRTLRGVPNGELTDGWLLFTFPGLPQDALTLPGTSYHLTYKDAANGQYEAAWSSTGRMETISSPSDFDHLPPSVERVSPNDIAAAATDRVLLIPQIDGSGTADSKERGYIKGRGGAMIGPGAVDVRTLSFEIDRKITQIAISMDAVSDLDRHDFQADIRVASKYIKYASVKPSDRRKDFTRFWIDRPALLRSPGLPIPMMMLHFNLPRTGERIAIIVSYAAAGVAWTTQTWWLSYSYGEGRSKVVLTPTARRVRK